MNDVSCLWHKGDHMIYKLFCNFARVILVTATLVTTALRTKYFELQYHLVRDEMFYIYALLYLQLSNSTASDEIFCVRLSF